MKRVVLGLVLASCDSNPNCDPEPVSKRLTIDTPAEPALQLRLESCRVDIDACHGLCELALDRLNIANSAINGCKVGFTDAQVLMDVDYTPISDCFFEGDDVAFPNGGF